MLGYTTKTSNNKHLFKRIDKNPFVILQKNEQNMFRLLKIIRNYREEISYIEIKQLTTDKMTIKAQTFRSFANTQKSIHRADI